MVAILGGIGGIVAFLAGVAAVLRGIFRQISATEDNTAAIHGLSERLDRQDGKLDDYGTRIARLEGFGRRRG
jgi:hypothetical protein